MKISVIIPTYNRKNILIKCLDALFEQTYPMDDFEIVVVDDGSTDGTESIVKDRMVKSPVGLRYFKQEKKGPAAARNMGIESAKGEIVLFIGDDIIASPLLLEEHVKWHNKYSNDSLAVLGYVTWSPDIEITPFLEWLDESGAQFGYKLINDPDNVSYRFYYTSNASVKKEFLLKHGLFDEDFPYAAMEDIEIAYRLKDKGLKIVYKKSALAYHEHKIDMENFLKRSELVGRSMGIFYEKHPLFKKETKNFPIFNLKTSIKFLIWGLTFLIGEIMPKRLLFLGYSYLVSKHMRKGYYGHIKKP